MTITEVRGSLRVARAQAPDVPTQEKLLRDVLSEFNDELRIEGVTQWARSHSSKRHMPDGQLNGLCCAPILLGEIDNRHRAPAMAVTFYHPTQTPDQLDAVPLCGFSADYAPGTHAGIVAAQLGSLMLLHRNGFLPNYWPGTAEILSAPTHLPNALFME